MAMVEKSLDLVDLQSFDKAQVGSSLPSKFSSAVAKYGALSKESGKVESAIRDM